MPLFGNQDVKVWKETAIFKSWTRVVQSFSFSDM